MPPTILFRESQRFKQAWLWILLLGVNGFFLYGLFKQVYTGQAFGSKPMGDGDLLFATGIALLVTLLIASIRLETMIGPEGLYVRFFPFIWRWKKYPWNQLSRCYVRQYSPLGEFGGWGLRLGLFGRGKAYNISGNQGIQLEFADKSRLLIGTRKPGEAAAVLQQIGKG